MRVCDERWSEPLSAWIDGEAEPEEQARIEAHLARCEACASAAEAYRALGEAMRDASRSPVPARAVARARALVSAPERAAPSERRRARWPWAAVGAVALAAAGLLAVGKPAPSLEEALARDLVGQHLRGFARARPCEIESDDPVAVRSWVEARLGYGVAVPAPEGVELIGARACTIGGQATAALLYRHEGAPITLFVPPPGSEAVASAARFASSGSRCVEGPIGERICVSGTASQRAFAVADLPEEQVLPLLVR